MNTESRKADTLSVGEAARICCVSRDIIDLAVRNKKLRTGRDKQGRRVVDASECWLSSAA